MTLARTLEQQIDDVARRLVDELTGHVDAAAVQAEVRKAAAELDGSRVTQYVPVLVHRTARDRLRHRGQDARALA